MVSFDSVTELLVYVEDMERMVAFYQEAFDLQINVGAAEHGFVRFDTAGTGLCLHAGRDGPIGEFAPKFVFGVEDLDAAYDHLRQFDIDLGEIRTEGHGTRLFDGRDPEGNRFSIEALD